MRTNTLNQGFSTLKYLWLLAMSLILVVFLGGCGPFTEKEEDVEDGATTKTSGGMGAGSGWSSGNIITNGLGMDLVYVAGGQFQMGHDEVTFAKAHKVEITKPYFIGQTEVTQAQWKKLMSTTKSFQKGSSLPVVNVKYSEIEQFLEKLSKEEGRTYRLPTEAEWERASRAGTDSLFFWGNSPEGGKGYANFNGIDELWNSEIEKEEGEEPFPYKDGFEKLAIVKSFKPNAWGLYDMLGNAQEVVGDWYGEYPDKPLNVDPKGTDPSSSCKVLRGGGWMSKKGEASSFSRTTLCDSNQEDSVGFRVVMEFDSTKDKLPTSMTSELTCKETLESELEGQGLEVKPSSNGLRIILAEEKLFETDKSILVGASSLLSKMATTIGKYGVGTAFQVLGYTDWIGQNGTASSATGNFALSTQLD